MIGRPGPKQRRAVFFLLAISVFAISYYAGNRNKTVDAVPISGLVMRPPAPAPEFQLFDQSDESFSQEQLRGSWNLLVLDPQSGTASPAFYRMVQVYNRLAIESELQRQTHFIYVPRESSDDIKAGAGRLGPNFIALHGSGREVDETFLRFGVSEITNNFTLYLIDPEARIHALFTDVQDAATIAADLKAIISNQNP
ncbi:hypothetical protein DJ031_02410 [bacterium endosymbiont of Escarpia laminata]|nr:MAG: hypothetical protein DJ031_02410 [bacterium endosymbiont of Escarpia laminata]